MRLIFLAAGLLFSGQSIRLKGPESAKHVEENKKRADFFDVLDANGDGVISETERLRL